MKDLAEQCTICHNNLKETYELMYKDYTDRIGSYVLVGYECPYCLKMRNKEFILTNESYSPTQREIDEYKLWCDRYNNFLIWDSEKLTTFVQNPA